MSSFMRVLERNAEIRTIDQKCKRTYVYFCDEHLVQAFVKKSWLFRVLGAATEIASDDLSMKLDYGTFKLDELLSSMMTRGQLSER